MINSTKWAEIGEVATAWITEHVTVPGKEKP